MRWIIWGERGQGHSGVPDRQRGHHSVGLVCGSNIAYNLCGPQCVVFLGSNPFSAAWGDLGAVILLLRGGFLPVSIAQDGLAVHVECQQPLLCTEQPHSVLSS